MALSKEQSIRKDIHEILQPNEAIAKSYPCKWHYVTHFDGLSLGDHVCYFRFPYYRHGVIIEKNKQDQKVKQLRYHLSKGEIYEEIFQYWNGSFYVLDGSYQKHIYLSKATYSGPCFNSDKVVQRALARCNERQYDPITNFARAYPRWCRTGIGGLTAINQIQLNESREVIHHVHMLVKGDHIMFDRGPYYHHAIVLSVNPLKNTMDVVHFTIGRSAGKGSIKREVITRHEQVGILYRLTYRKLTESKPDVVALRAVMISDGGLDYDLLQGNCEHLATWCKTGIWGSEQVKSWTVYILRQLFNLGVKLGPQILVRLIGEGFASLVDILASVYVNVCGHKVDIISSIIFCTLDIAYNCYSIGMQYKRGHLKGEALQEEIWKRVVRCFVVDSSVVLGNILGQIFIPVPILNAFIGGLCGLALGELINFCIQKIAAVIKSTKAKVIWEETKHRLQKSPEYLKEMLEKMPCSSHSDTTCIGLA